MSTSNVVALPDGTGTPADGLALACHEARHVRVLTKAGCPPRDGVEAWRTFPHPRRTAALETDRLET